MCRHSGSHAAIACDDRTIVFGAAEIRKMLSGPSS